MIKGIIYIVRGVQMKKKFFISFFISLLCFTLIFAGLDKVGYFERKFTTATGEDDFDDVGKDLDLGEDNEIKQRNKNEILFLMMGVDAKDVKKSKGTRTDTMMLFKVNFETGEIDLMSIPRDTRVLVRGKEDKINHAHAFGGPSLTMQTLRDFLNLDVDYYVKVDYKVVMEVVDKIGGVTIDVPRNMRYFDPNDSPPLNINIKKGVQTLDGKNAHDFLRWRHNNDYTVGYPEGDIGRIKTQQMFMKELIKQTMKPKNIVNILDFIRMYYDYVETNIPMSVMLKGAASFKKLDVENMTTATIPGEGKKINKIDYWIYDRQGTEELVDGMFADYLLD